MEKEKILNEIWPIGSIYIFLNDITKNEGIKKLNELIGGEWEYLTNDLKCIYFKRIK